MWTENNNSCGRMNCFTALVFLLIFILFSQAVIVSETVDADFWVTSSTGFEPSSSIMVKAGQGVIEGKRGNNSSPSLYWTMESNYMSGGVHPSTGVSTDTFVFRVSYLDADNDDPRLSPGFIFMVLNGENHTMETVDEFYSDGSIFETTITGLVPAEYSYYFICSDGDATIRFPQANASLPVINTRPSLLVPFATSHSDIPFEGTVHPTLANATDIITFQIIYLDIDGHSPSSDRSSRGVYIDNVYHSMAPQEGVGDYYDGDYTNGEMFELETPIHSGHDHSYYFEFTDSMEATNHTATFYGPVIVEGFPDIRISRDELGQPSMVGTPVSTAPGDWRNINVSAVIENPSEYSVNSPFHVSFETSLANRETGEYGVVDVQTVIVGHLYSLQEVTVNISFMAPVMGKYLTTVIVDSGQDIMEMVDNNDTLTNNMATVHFVVGPDLDMGTGAIQPSSMFVGQNGVITARIFNGGQTLAIFGPDDMLVVEFTVGAQTYMDIMECSIPPGQFVVASTEFNHFSSEEFVINVRVDPDNVLEEVSDYDTFDNNNAGVKMLSVIERSADYYTPSFSPNVLAMLFSQMILVLFYGFVGFSRSKLW